MLLFKPIIVVAFAALLPSVQAEQNPPITELRESYIHASKQDWDLDSQAYLQKLDELKTYPLKPYFQLEQLQRYIHLDYEPQIASFIEQHQDTPLDWPLRGPWLRYLISENQAQRFLTYYRPTRNKYLVCQYHNYQLGNKQHTEQWHKDIERLWLTGKSLPKSCDPVLSKWRQQGHLTNTLLWQRILLSHQQRSYSLMRYLGRQLPASEQYLWSLWQTLRKQPSAVVDLTAFKRGNRQEGMLITYALRRLAFADEVLTLNVYQQAVEQNRLTEQQQKSVLARLLPAVAGSTDAQAIAWYQRQHPELISESALQYKLASHIQHQDYHAALQELERLTEEQKQDRQWQYWQARIYQLVGKQQQADEIYQTLAQARSFYGFLAAAHAGNESALNHQPLAVSEINIDQFAHPQAGKRALELFELERYHQARKEWHFWLSQLPSEQRIKAAKLAFNHGWYDRAILALTKSRENNDLDVRFPMPLKQVYADNAAQYDVNPAWAYAITRKESIFMSDAISSAGALGLMQILPSTARYITGDKSVSKGHLLNAKNNVDIGFRYLKYLLQKFDNNIVLATAAYNAGPHKVTRWLKESPSMTMEKWIETIPYKETRNYVKSVLAFTEIYMHKLGQKQSAFSDIIGRQIHEQ
ncbi:transglycosylase SLT domain-containing protein [Thalassotalea ponticola]|uniref:transglycosylase SLT domain-containing protein n=1 Tax=Thalassotalea ponticola TaxID=1523392 RepID=UPI0025B5B821|nr:transglycosylase SLT domain-containing protein [Thalassotalea ponticola]MDN3653056.1 transglycosylase SLT domain-containing protein [Thalassotalea ponticola]